ncbi:MAG: hypothetical protein DI586_00940 [Micavibrio aeruginosavorus]|uniref:Endonuclease/exonuclease/phosphatase domain-containing protein n=1 Tax=Micavibrio aeruginosavorus TaxID=349221 RepID=A0A2W5HGG4_9BACT|nr:MAG: hypothetical protein DI586_00940 [Micavibrio aeruginosavorus]
MKILFSNLGYARGIDGSLWHHVSRAGRHLYCTVPPQQLALSQLKEVMNAEQPDLCCFVEIDKGAFHSSYLNQMEALRDESYRFSDITNKYGEDHFLSRLPFHKSKCNGFLAKHDLPFEKLYFKSGRKRLIYRMMLPEGIMVYFAHFSLQSHVRIEQFNEIGHIIRNDGRPSILLADFNIFQGFSEIAELLNNANLKLMNRDGEHTFRFHRRQHILDLCLATDTIAPRIDLRIIPQPYSDHAALFLEIR